MSKKPQKGGCDKFDEIAEVPAGTDPADWDQAFGRTFGTAPIAAPAEKCRPEIAKEARQLGAVLGLGNVKTYIVESSTRNALSVGDKDGAPDTERDIYLPSIAIDNGSQQWEYYLANKLARSLGAKIPPALVPNEAERKEIRDAIVKSIRETGLIKEHKIDEIADERSLNLQYDIISARLTGPTAVLGALNAEQEGFLNAVNQLNGTKNARSSGMPDASYGGPPPDPNKPVRPADTYHATPAITEEAFYDDPRFDDPMNPTGPAPAAPYDLRKAFVQKYGKEVSPAELAAGTHVAPAPTPPPMISSSRGADQQAGAQVPPKPPMQR